MQQHVAARQVIWHRNTKPYNVQIIIDWLFIQIVTTLYPSTILRILFAGIHPNINLIGRVYFETLKALQPLHVMLHVPIIANE